MIARATVSIAALLLLGAANRPTNPLPPPMRVPPAALGADVAGAWIVDLRESDSAQAYTQPMVLTVTMDARVTGEFYNSTISSGRYRRARGRSCVAFVTSDGAGDYQHAACLVGGQMVGQSWAEHRRFVLPWVASR